MKMNKQSNVSDLKSVTSVKKFSKNILWAGTFWFILCTVLFIFTDKVILPIISGQLTSTIEIPAVEGLEAPEAEATILAADLGVIWREDGKYSSLVPEGQVLTQLPQAGRVVKVGRNIRLTKSLGKRKTPLPNLRGESLRQGKITLKRLGVVQGKTIKGSHSTIPRGVIIRSLPQEGSMVRAGDSISLVISSGRIDKTTLLPNLTETSLDDAKQQLQELGFEPGQVIEEKSDKHIAGTVINQYPRAGEYLPAYSKINLTISQ